MIGWSTNLNSGGCFPQRLTQTVITGSNFIRSWRVGDLLGRINYLGTHTMRKTGAYRVYTQSNYSIGLVMHLLNHSRVMTLTYLGLDQASWETMLDEMILGIECLNLVVVQNDYFVESSLDDSMLTWGKLLLLMIGWMEANEEIKIKYMSGNFNKHAWHGKRVRFHVKVICTLFLNCLSIFRKVKFGWKYKCAP